jgi:hypothetical protein
MKIDDQFASIDLRDDLGQRKGTECVLSRVLLPKEGNEAFHTLDLHKQHGPYGLYDHPQPFIWDLFLVPETSHPEASVQYRGRVLTVTNEMRRAVM